MSMKLGGTILPNAEQLRMLHVADATQGSCNHVQYGITSKTLQVQHPRVKLVGPACIKSNHRLNS